MGICTDFTESSLWSVRLAWRRPGRRDPLRKDLRQAELLSCQSIHKVDQQGQELLSIFRGE